MQGMERKDLYPTASFSPASQHERKRRSGVLTKFTVVAAVAALPIAVAGASDTFWGGNDFSNTTDRFGVPILAPEVQEEIHDSIKDNLPNIFDFSRGIGPNRMPPGEFVDNADRGVRIYMPHKTWDGYTLLNAFGATEDGTGGFLKGL